MDLDFVPLYWGAMDPQRFAQEFAAAVTVRSSHRYDWVARKGKFSIYDLIQDLFPTVRLSSDLYIESVKKVSCRPFGQLEATGTNDFYC